MASDFRLLLFLFCVIITKCFKTNAQQYDYGEDDDYDSSDEGGPPGEDAPLPSDLFDFFEEFGDIGKIHSGRRTSSSHKKTASLHAPKFQFFPGLEAFPGWQYFFGFPGPQPLPPVGGAPFILPQAGFFPPMADMSSSDYTDESDDEDEEEPEKAPPKRKRRKKQRA